jgi:hypothetical protein
MIFFIYTIYYQPKALQLKDEGFGTKAEGVVDIIVDFNGN